MAETAPAKGPDFASGISLKACPEEGTIAGRVGDNPVLLSRIDGDFFAIGATCTHYGGALAEGLIGKCDVRCPLHHACFDLRTGAVLRAPALNPLDRWQIEIEGERLFVRERLRPVSTESRPTTGVRRVVIIGGGAAGLACAIKLRTVGFDGSIAIVSEDEDPPYDRPNLSKDYLAGDAPDEWMPLRSDDWYEENGVDLRLGSKAEILDLSKREVGLRSGERLPFDRLLLAMGSEPKLVDGFSGENVFTLRSSKDARALINRARPNSRAVILGSSFIGLEAAAALTRRNVNVTVVAPEKVPFELVFGPELGRYLQRLHEDRGVTFHLGTTATRFTNSEVELRNGTKVQADFILVGVGVKPRTGLAEAAGLRVDNGVWVDQWLETDCAGIFAAGDIAAYPDRLTGERIRIEHWIVAERQGQIAAANMLGARESFNSAPFFWTEQHGVVVRYVGHATSWDEVRIAGEIDRSDCVLRYYRNGKHRASASVNRDQENLKDELLLEAMARPA